jgi:hypothetical protein
VDAALELIGRISSHVRAIARTCGERSDPVCEVLLLRLACLVDGPRTVGAMLPINVRENRVKTLASKFNAL